MSKFTNRDDAAYPESHPECPDPSRGLTKREYFAAAALKGLLACPDVDAAADDLAGLAIKAADALIDALNKEPSK